MLSLESAVAPALKSCGFKKKGQTWWRAGDETIQVLNLQKSQFADTVYVNVGIYLRRLGEEVTPPVNRCHIGARLERVLPELHAEIAAASTNTEPSPELRNAITVNGIAWLESMSSLRGITQFLASGGATKSLVFASVRQLLAEANDA